MTAWAGCLRNKWVAQYNWTPQARLMGADSLVARTYRDWKGGTPTVPEVTKCRSPALAVRPETQERVQLGGNHYLSTSAPPEVRINSVIDYYWGLRTLTMTWAYVGNFSTPDGIMMPCLTP